MEAPTWPESLSVRGSSALTSSKTRHHGADGARAALLPTQPGEISVAADLGLFDAEFFAHRPRTTAGAAADDFASASAPLGLSAATPLPVGTPPRSPFASEFTRPRSPFAADDIFSIAEGLNPSMREGVETPGEASRMVCPSDPRSVMDGLGIGEDMPFSANVASKGSPEGCLPLVGQCAGAPLDSGENGDELRRNVASILTLRRWLAAKFGDLGDLAKYIMNLEGTKPDAVHGSSLCSGIAVNRTALLKFLTEAGYKSTSDCTLHSIMQCLDPTNTGVIDLADILGPAASNLDVGAAIDGDKSPPYADTYLELSHGPARIEAIMAGAVRDDDDARAKDAGDQQKATVEDVLPAAKVLDMLAEAEAERRRSEDLELHEPHWQVLQCVFARVARDGCEEVPLQPFLREIRNDERVRQESLLERVIKGAAGDRRTTLGHALEHVEAQLLQTVSWQRFRRFLHDAPRDRRPSLRELMAESAARRDGHLASKAGRIGDDCWGSAACSTREGRPAPRVPAVPVAKHPSLDGEVVDPNRDPGAANQWMEEELGLDGAMLRRIYSRFVNCQGRGGLARTGDFVQCVQKCDSLVAALATVPLIPPEKLPPGQPKARPGSWGDVILDLACHESGILSWADVLETVRWHRDLCLGYVVANPVSASRGSPGPALANGPSRGRLAKLLLGCYVEESNAQADSEPPVNTDKVLMPSTAVDTATDLPAPQADIARGEKAIANLAAFARGMHHNAAKPATSGQRERHTRHPLLDYDSDGELEAPGSDAVTQQTDEHEAVARLLTAARVPAARVAASPAAHTPALEPTAALRRHVASSAESPGNAWSGSGRQAALRLRVDANYKDWHQCGVPIEHLEQVMADALGVDPSAVRLKPVQQL